MKKDSFTVIQFIFCITIILLLSGDILNADGAEIHVPGDYSTIQDAIDHAIDEDIIIIAEGTYSENINFNGKGITVKSTDPNNSAIVEDTIITGGTGGICIVTFNNGEESSSILCGVSVRNGGVGISCSSSSPSIIKCIIKENSNGGGIRCINSSPKIIYCNIIDNSVDSYFGRFGCYAPFKANGGGIYLSNSSPIITNCVISGNSAYAGGDGCCRIGMPGTGTYLTITYAGYGGGIYCQNSSPIITNCVISRNSASASTNPIIIWPDFGLPFYCYGSIIGYGGGIYCINSSSSIINCSIVENSAKYIIPYPPPFLEYKGYKKGGGIYSDNSSLFIKNCIFWDDQPEEIYIDSNSSALVTYSNIEGGYSGEGEGNLNENPLLCCYR